MPSPLVSIITINYNTPEVTGAMLQSLSRLNYPNWEVIVVDNASPEHSSAYLKRDYPFILHVSSPVNLGFAGGNNIGLHFARGEYILFLNNDTEVTAGLLTTLVEHLQHNPGCGIACPKVKYYSQPGLIQYAGTVGPHPLTSRSYDIGFMQKDSGQFDDIRITDQPNGAAMMVPAEAIKRVGEMSEIFFLYYEELDWAARFKKAGLEIHYVGTAEILHRGSATTGLNSAFKTYYLYRNRFLYIRRNYHGAKLLIATAFFIFFSSPFHIARHALKNEWAHSKSIWRALLWNLQNGAFKEPAIDSTSIITNNGRLITT